MSNPGRFGGRSKCVLVFSRLLFLVVALLVVTRTAGAQTSVVNPRTVSFVASADQNTVDSTGRALITEYDLQFLPAGGTTPVQVLNLGKPTPASDGTITIDFSSLLSSPPSPGQQLDAVVVAVGPDGSGASSPSNTFTFDCTATVTPTSVSATAQAMSGSISVSSYTGCGWQATSGTSWITVASGASGTGNGAVNYSIAANSTTATRTGTLAVAGQTVTITQAAGATSNTPPSVALTSPTSGSSYTAPASITLVASASDANGTVSRVDFYANNTVVASVTAAPYSFAWTNVAAGNYTITAVATDNAGAQTTSAAVAISVAAPAPPPTTPDLPPTVSITSPANGAMIVAQSATTISASAGDSDGTVTKVDFYANGSVVGTATSSPYSIRWNPPASGTYTLTAVATDNASLTTTSSAISVTIQKKNGRK